MSVRSRERNRLSRVLVRPLLCLALLVCLVMVWMSCLERVQAQEDAAGQVLARINQARQEQGLAPLARNPQLDAAAQAHADDMLRSGSGIGHRGSDGSRYQQRIARAGYSSGVVGENWASYRSLDNIFDFWLNDAPHRQNILNRKFTQVGIGVAQRANGGLVVVTDFGNPDGAPIAQSAAVQPAPTSKPVKATKPKPTAKPKPAQAPTLQPTRKPKVKRQSQPTPAASPAAPTAAPVAQVALAVAPPPPPAPVIVYRLTASGRGVPADLSTTGASQLGTIPYTIAPNQFGAGAALALSGASLLAAAVVGQSSRTRRRRR